MRVVKAAAVQLSPVLYSREGTVEKITQTIQDLGRQRVKFATFPETARGCAPSTAMSAALANWHVGNTTIPWRGTR